MKKMSLLSLSQQSSNSRIHDENCLEQASNYVIKKDYEIDCRVLILDIWCILVRLSNHYFTEEASKCFDISRFFKFGNYTLNRLVKV